MSRRTYFVVNPNSAGGRTGKNWPQIRARLERELGEVTVGTTERPNQATALTRRAIEDGFELIVAVGGDGTINEVINGFFTREGPVNPDAAFGIFQRGTGGDFKRTLGMSGEAEEYIESLRGDAVKRIDVGKLTFTSHKGDEGVRHFLNVASFGIGGVFDFYLNRSAKRLPGRFATTWAGIRAAIAYKNQPVRVRLDGGREWEARINNVSVANGQYYGGGMHIAPQAELDDGQFDVVTAGDFTLREMLSFSRKIYKGTHLQMRKVEFQRAQVITADSDETVLLDVDGEQPGRLPATFELLHRVLPLKIASGAK